MPRFYSQTKTLYISNCSNETLSLVFCTISDCTCSVCEEWTSCEKYPIAGGGGATYGALCVDPQTARTDEFCPRWDCVGACFLGPPPPIISRDVLVDFDETQDYSLFGGRVQLLFRSGSAAAASTGAYKPWSAPPSQQQYRQQYQQYYNVGYNMGYDIASRLVEAVVEDAVDGCDIM